MPVRPMALEPDASRSQRIPMMSDPTTTCGPVARGMGGPQALARSIFGGAVYSGDASRAGAVPAISTQPTFVPGVQVGHASRGVGGCYPQPRSLPPGWPAPIGAQVPVPIDRVWPSVAPPPCGCPPAGASRRPDVPSVSILPNWVPGPPMSSLQPQCPPWAPAQPPQSTMPLPPGVPAGPGRVGMLPPGVPAGPTFQRYPGRMMPTPMQPPRGTTVPGGGTTMYRTPMARPTPVAPPSRLGPPPRLGPPRFAPASPSHPALYQRPEISGYGFGSADGIVGHGWF